MDPRVASRQRVVALVFTCLAVIVAIATPLLFPELKTILGPWYLVLMMAGVLGVFSIAVWSLRGALLSTRVNRRLTGLVGLSVGGILAQRGLAALIGMNERQTVLDNYLLVCVVCLAGGLTVHNSFFRAIVPMVLGLGVAAVVPSNQAAVFGASGLLALAVLAQSLQGWRGEFAPRAPTRSGSKADPPAP